MPIKIFKKTSQSAWTDGIPHTSIRMIQTTPDTSRGSTNVHPYAEVQYYEPTLIPNFDYSTPVPEWGNRMSKYGLSRAYTNYVAETKGVSAWAKTDEEFNKYPMPTTLFTQTPPHVTTLFADRTMRMHVPALLGAVHEKARETGTKILASDSLSKHSSPLVKEGIGAGLVQGHADNPEANVNNEIGTSVGDDTYLMDPRDVGDEYYVGTEVSDDVVERWRKTGRELVRTVRGKPPVRQTTGVTHPVRDSQQFEQLKLF